MKLKQSITPKLELKLKPVPLLILKAQILSVPVLELEELIIQEVESNPMLELPEIPLETTIREIKKRSEYLPYQKELNSHPLGGYEEDEPSAEELLEAPPVSVWDRLEAQIEIEFNGKELDIAKKILDNLNGEGFLEISEEEIARQLEVPVEKVREVRRAFMELDPPGSGSLNAIEFMFFQLYHRGIISEEEFEKFSKLPVEEAKRVLEGIKQKIGEHGISLSPYPFNLYERDSNIYIIPEIIFRVVDGRIQVELYDSPYVSLQVNPVYEAMLDDPQVPKEVKKFLAEKYKKAQLYREALIMRKQYLKRIGEYIAEKQREFLLGKRNKPVPIPQVRAARELDIPVSTLNRILSGKYADTPRGVFLLRFFFPRGVKGQILGEELDQMIREIIESEDPSHPLSDAKIAEILRQRGINIKRRTVAQRREAMGIPASFKRKKNV